MPTSLFSVRPHLRHCDRHPSSSSLSCTPKVTTTNHHQQRSLCYHHYSFQWRPCHQPPWSPHGLATSVTTPSIMMIIMITKEEPTVRTCQRRGKRLNCFVHRAPLTHTQNGSRAQRPCRAGDKQREGSWSQVCYTEWDARSPLNNLRRPSNQYQ